MELKEYTFLNNMAVKRIIQNLKGLGYNKLASKINPDAKGYLKTVFDPEDVDGNNTRQLLEIAENYDILSEP